MPDSRRARCNGFVAALVIVACTTSLGRSALGVDGVDAGKTPIQRTATETRTPAASPPSGIGGTTLVLLGLLLAGAIVGRRILQRRSRKGFGRTPHAVVTLLGRQQVDVELSVRLLQIGPRLLVVGSSPQGLATLCEITDLSEVAAVTGSVRPMDQTSASQLFSGQRPIGRSTESHPGRDAAPSQPSAALRNPTSAGSGG